MAMVRKSVSAAIYGCAGERLTGDEKALFRECDPYGFILFARNCKDRAQVKALVDEMREVSGRADVPVLIDQEGGRVARLKPPVWRLAPAAGVFAGLAAKDAALAEKAVYLNARLIAAELVEIGVNVDCAPLLDVPVPGSHDIIGDRAYGTEVGQVSRLGRAMAEGLLDGGVMPVIKHLPGHGRATADSHLELPVVNVPCEDLVVQDFAPFKALAAMPYAMTAHVLYTALDDRQVATFSPDVIAMIRKDIGFDGVLMSDDLSMKALKGPFAERVQRSLSAGCDLVLHCNGDFAEMAAIAEATPALSAEARRRVEALSVFARSESSFDVAAAEASLGQWLAPLAA